MEWYDLFARESLELLYEESDKHNGNRYITLKRKQLFECLETIPTIIDLSWRYVWNRTVDQIRHWKGVNLTKQELDLIDQIDGILKDKFESIMEGTYQLDRGTLENMERLRSLLNQHINK